VESSELGVPYKVLSMMIILFVTSKYLSLDVSCRDDRLWVPNLLKIVLNASVSYSVWYNNKTFISYLHNYLKNQLKFIRISIHIFIPQGIEYLFGKLQSKSSISYSYEYLISATYPRETHSYNTNSFGQLNNTFYSSLDMAKNNLYKYTIMFHLSLFIL